MFSGRHEEEEGDRPDITFLFTALARSAAAPLPFFFLFTFVLVFFSLFDPGVGWGEEEETIHLAGGGGCKREARGIKRIKYPSSPSFFPSSSGREDDDVLTVYKGCWCSACFVPRYATVVKGERTRVVCALSVRPSSSAFLPSSTSSSGQTAAAARHYSTFAPHPLSANAHKAFWYSVQMSFFFPSPSGPSS